MVDDTWCMIHYPWYVMPNAWSVMWIVDAVCILLHKLLIAYHSLYTTHRVKFNKPEPQILKKIHSPQYFILRPLSCPYVFIGARGIQENYQNWKKIAAEHIYMHFSKIVLKKGCGFVKVLARSGTWGARHNISDPEKKSINSARAFFRHMRAPKFFFREDEVEKT